MKKTSLCIAMAAAALAMFAGSAGAANSGNLAVTATVVAACEFSTSTAVGFGTLDQTAAGPATVTAPTPGSVSFWCTKGATYTITMNDGANSVAAGQKRMIGPGATPDYINYSLTPATATGTGVGFSTLVTVAVNGSVNKAAFADVAAGAYSDTVLVTIAP